MKKLILLLVLVNVSFLITGCGSFKEFSSQETIKNKQEESEGNKMNTKAANYDELGEKQKEGNLFRGDFDQFTPYLNKLEQLVTVPKEYELQEVQTGIKQNNEEIIRFRFGPVGKEVNLFEEHYSVVIREKDTKLLGIMSIDSKDIINSPKALPSEKETEDITKKFLDNIESEYYLKLNNLWIDQHDEPLIFRNKEQIVSGTKYKCFVPSEQTYAWVVVNQNRKVMIFERGVYWENNGRTTEKWLYDQYLKDGTLELFEVRKK